jgi:hypothetical protein
LLDHLEGFAVVALSIVQFHVELGHWMPAGHPGTHIEELQVSAAVA